MPLTYQIIKIPMVSGVDTKIDPKQLPPQKMSVLENARFDKVGTVNKRLGSSSPLTNAASSAVGLFRHKETPVIMTNTQLLPRNGQGGGWGSNTNYDARLWRVKNAPVYGRPTTSTSYLGRCDYTALSGYEVVAWEDGTGIRAEVRNTSNGATSATSLSVASASEPRCVAVGTKMFVFYRSAANTISCRYITASGIPSWSNAVSVATDYAAATTGTYDVAADTSTAHIIVVWNLTATNGYKITRLSGTDGTVVTAAVTRANYDIGVAVAPCPDGQIVVVSASTTDVYADIFSSALANTAGPTDIANITASGYTSLVAKCKSTSAAGVYSVYVAWQGSAGTNIGVAGIVYKTDNTTAALSAFPAGTNYLGIASKWWEDSATGYMHMCVCHDGEDGDGVSIYPTLFAVNENGYFMARMLPGAAASRSADDLRHFFPTSVIAAGTNDYRMAQVARESVQDFVDSSQAVTVVAMKTDDGTVRKGVEAGGSLFLPGGWLWQFDGRQVAESSFSTYPVKVSANAVAGAGTLTNAKDYSYVVFYKRRTAAGEVEWSAPSAPITTDTNGVGEDTIEVTVPNYITGNQRDAGDVYIEIYRTEADPGPDALYYRAGSVANVRTTATQVFTDTVPDTSLVDNALNIFGSGELQHIAPPPAHVIAAGKDRLFLSDGEVVYYSKIRNPGEPVAFSEEGVLPVPQAGGEVTGLAILNDLLIVFRENAIYYVAGDGPNNLGQGAFGSIQLASLDCGCSDQRSIVNMPLGLMFKSSKGIYLLDRNLQTSYIGAPVESFNSQNVTGTLLHEDKNEVRFLTSTTSGYVLVYDYFVNQWCADGGYPDAEDGRNGREGVGITQAGGTIYYAKADGNTYSEDTGFADGSTARYGLKATTGWIKVDSMHGWMKVRRFLITGAYKSAGTVRVRVAYDYNETFVDTYNYTLVNETPMKFRGRFSRMKCSAVKIEVSTTGTSTGEEYSLSEIALEVGMNPGLARLPNAYTINET